MTRERILAAARGMRYRPNVLAQSLRLQRAFTIGVLVPDLAGVGPALAQAMTDTLRTAGYDVLLATHHMRPALVASRARLMIERQVDGLIVADGVRIRNAPVPVVSLAYTFHRVHASPASVVEVDLASSADAAIRHVVELGHRRLVLLTATRRFGYPWERALRNAARRMGVSIDSRWTGGGDASSFERAYLATRDLISDDPRYTTVFTADDGAAMGVLRALRESDLAVPSDVSVVGFGDYLGRGSVHATPDDSTDPVTGSW